MARALYTIHHRGEDGSVTTYLKGFYIPDEVAATFNPKVVDMDSMPDGGGARAVAIPAPEVVGGVVDSSETTPPPASVNEADDDDNKDGEVEPAAGGGDDTEPLLALSKADLLVMADAWDCTGLTDRDTKATIAEAIRDAGYDGDGTEMLG